MEPTIKELKAIEAERPKSPKALTTFGARTLMEALAEYGILYADMLTWTNRRLYDEAKKALGLEEVEVLLLIN